MKILVADDDRGAQTLLRALLSKLGHEVVVASHGVEAWRLLGEARPRMLVTDWNMPGMTGVDLCRRLRKDPSRAYVYVVLVTTRDDMGSFSEGMAAGADDFLTKPVDVALLAARVRVAERILSLQEEVHDLRSKAVPVCIYCRRLKEGDEWLDTEAFVVRHAGGGLADRICPECYSRHLASELDKL